MVNARHLYIHVPFCARRCVYCDFSIAVRSPVPAREFVEAIGREWTARRGDLRLALDTLYLGGGTPSKLGGDGIARLMEVVRAHATVAPDAELTLEANPEDVTAVNARAWREAGINRVSLGVQSFDDEVLRWMHRTHDAGAATRAVGVLRDEGLENISIDLIFAVPVAVRRSWQADVDTAAALGLPHVSVYGLTVEPHTPLGRWVASEAVAELPEEGFEREYQYAHDVFTDVGLEHYEVSNYGRAGRHSRHNWAYWRRTPYVGVGPSAHGFDGTARRWNESAYAAWLRIVSLVADPVAGSETLSPEQVVAEKLYLDMRTQTGLVLSDEEMRRTSEWVDCGWATVGRDGRLRLTALGWLRLDALANDLTLVRSRY